MTNRKDLNDGKEMTFLDHLEVLRWHIVRSFIAIFVLAIVAFVFHDFIFDRIIFAPKEPDFWTNRVLCQFGEWIGSEKLCINSKPLGIFNINFT